MDQPPSSAYEGGGDDDLHDDDGQSSRASPASVTSLCSEPPQPSLQPSLPPPHQPLALLHVPHEHHNDQDDVEEHDDDGEDDSSDETATEIMEGRMEDGEGEELEGGNAMTDHVQEGGTGTARAEVEEAVAEAEDTSTTVGKAGSGAKGQGAVKDTVEGMLQTEEYIVGCLLNDANGQEQLQPLPETKVMFYTQTILDNIHAPMDLPKCKEACTASVGTNNAAPPSALPIKSALASQTGLSAKTRKAVSFSIIATEQSADSVVMEERCRETGVQANLGTLYSHTVAQALASEKSEPVQGAASVLPQSDSQTTAAEVLLRSSSKNVQIASNVQINMPHGNSDLVGASSQENDIFPASSHPHVELSETNALSTQEMKFDNQATAAKFFKTVPLSRKVSPEPKKNIYETRRWPFRSPRLVYQRMKSQSKLSVAYLLGSQENLVNMKSKQSSSSSPVANHSTILPAHQEESGEEDTVGSHISHEIQTLGNMQKGNSTNKLKQSGINNEIDTSESGAHANEKNKHIPPNQDNTKGPLQTVADMVRTKLGVVKEKNMNSPQREKSQPKVLPKEKRNSPARYRRFFPNRYRVDLALVMTLERSRKLILPSMHSPWTPPKPDKQV